jgi:hypothetical protein
MKKAFLVLTAILLICSAAPASADVEWSADFFDVGYDNFQSNSYDGSGWIDLTVTNQSNYAWGDFHFFVFPLNADDDITDVYFVDSGPDSPASSQSPLTWTRSTDRQQIDLFYYSDPVRPGESALFSVHIENPGQVLHQVGYYPTVAPEPISSVLFVVGGITLGFRRLRKRG